jgi:hypothetical protein
MDVIVVNKTSKLVIIKVENERANKWPDEDSLFLIAQVLPGKAKCVGHRKLLFLITCSNWQLFSQ